MSTFVLLTSTPTTSWPLVAKQAAETQPTYPIPKILKRIFRLGYQLLASSGSKLKAQFGLCDTGRCAAANSQISANLFAACSHSNFSHTTARALSPNRLARRSSRSTRITASANSSGSFAINNSSPSRTAADAYWNNVGRRTADVLAYVIDAAHDPDSGIATSEVQ